MRSILLIACIALQLLVLASMVFSRESVIHGGQQVYLRTAPIDPRDPFRGDFVRLRYPMNNTSDVSVRWTDNDKSPGRGTKVYAILSESNEGLYQVEYITDSKPSSGLYIRGRAESKPYQLSADPGQPAAQALKFGVEQFFVEQGFGTVIENKQGVRGGMQVPLEVELAVGSNGTAVTTGYRWSLLGMELSFSDPQTATDAQLESEPSGRSMVVTLTNVSEQTVLVNNPGNDCGFVLEPAQLHYSDYQQAPNECDRTVGQALLTLESGKSYAIEVDLGDPRWYVTGDSGVPVDLRTLPQNELFRIVYRSPVEPANDSSSSVWTGHLPSQAFNGNGRID